MQTLENGRLIYDNAGEANQAAREWQARMGLSDWQVVVQIASIERFERPCNGDNLHDVRTRRAVIRLLDPADYDASTFAQDHEITLVHELEHVRVSELDIFRPDPDSPMFPLWDLALERMVDQSARNLVAARRK